MLVLLLALASCDSEDVAPKAPPRITFRETSYDHPRVTQGTPIEHTFAFVNDGRIPLAVLDLREACDCDATLADRSELPPGGAGAVRLSCRTDEAHGPLRRTVTVYSNDPDHRATLLTLTADVALDVAADPNHVYLGTVPAGATELRTVALLTSNGVRFAAAATDAQQVVARVDAAADGSTLIIGTAPSAPPGPFTALVRVPTTSAAHPVLRVQVAGTIAPPPTPEAMP